MSEKKKNKSLLGFIKKNLYYLVIGVSLVIIATVIAVVLVTNKKTDVAGRPNSETPYESEQSSTTGGGKESEKPSDDPVPENSERVTLDTVEVPKEGTNLASLFTPASLITGAPAGAGGENVFGAAGFGHIGGTNGGRIAQMAEFQNIAVDGLFGADFRDVQPEDISAELADVRNSSEIMPIFAVDEEGGTVVRVSKYPQFRAEPFPAQSEVLAEGGADGVHSDALEKAALLLSLGLNANLAPVCDVPRSGSDYIADRAFSTDPAEVSAAVAAAVRGYVEMRVLCALKHFPGYGDNSDTHTGISRDSRPMSEFEQTDLLPFRAGIEAGAPVVMVSHNIVECVDSEHPGSLSENMYALLRGLGFDGVIMTDDLSMDAIANICGEEQAAVTAFCAGADLLCSSDYENAVLGLIEAVKSGKISAERLDSSVRRILKMKLEYGIIQ